MRRFKEHIVDRKAQCQRNSKRHKRAWEGSERFAASCPACCAARLPIWPLQLSENSDQHIDTTSASPDLQEGCSGLLIAPKWRGLQRLPARRRSERLLATCWSDLLCCASASLPRR